MDDTLPWPEEAAPSRRGSDGKRVIDDDGLHGVLELSGSGRLGRSYDLMRVRWLNRTVGGQLREPLVAARFAH